MSKAIQETVTVTRNLDYRLADLIHFARYVKDATPEQIDDDKYMVGQAKYWWDIQHGDD